ncbi:MAG: hypothetical protein MJE68_17545 [Proteobacteria bacterium]|nr:hypothetical protein [Pseudomonadota bacterium]
MTDIAIDLRNRYPNLIVEMTHEVSKVSLIVRQKEMSMVSSVGPIHNPHLLVSSSVGGEPQLEFQVFFLLVCKEAYTSVVADAYLQSMLPGSGYAVCPGFPTEVSFKPKKYREWKLPFVRHDSKSCKLWHHPVHHKRSPEDPLYDSCPSCKLLWHDLSTLAKRA